MTWRGWCGGGTGEARESYKGILQGTLAGAPQNQDPAALLLHLNPAPLLLHDHAHCCSPPPPLRDARRRVVRAIVSALALARVGGGRDQRKHHVHYTDAVPSA